jgi:hypothetical protein
VNIRDGVVVQVAFNERAGGAHIAAQERKWERNLEIWGGKASKI